MGQPCHSILDIEQVLVNEFIYCRFLDLIEMKSKRNVNEKISFIEKSYSNDAFRVQLYTLSSHFCNNFFCKKTVLSDFIKALRSI